MANPTNGWLQEISPTVRESQLPSRVWRLPAELLPLKALLEDWGRSYCQRVILSLEAQLQARVRSALSCSQQWQQLIYQRDLRLYGELLSSAFIGQLSDHFFYPADWAGQTGGSASLVIEEQLGESTEDGRRRLESLLLPLLVQDVSEAESRACRDFSLQAFPAAFVCALQCLPISPYLRQQLLEQFQQSLAEALADFYSAALEACRFTQVDTPAADTAEPEVAAVFPEDDTGRLALELLNQQQALALIRLAENDFQSLLEWQRIPAMELVPDEAQEAEAQGTLASDGRREFDGRQELKQLAGVVELLFDFVLADRNLIAPVKALLAALRAPFIKLALLDKKFLQDRNHIVRQLLNEMARAALACQGDKLYSGDAAAEGQGVGNDPVLVEIKSVVAGLLEEFGTDIEPFIRAQQRFHAFVLQQQATQSSQLQHTLATEQERSQAQQYARLVDDQLNLRVVGLRLPEFIVRFLTEEWRSLLLADCWALSDSCADEGEGATAADPLNHRQFIEDLHLAEELIWSITEPLDEALTRAQLAQVSIELVASLPGLLRKLRRATSRINCDYFSVEHFFEQLKALHLACLGAASASVPADNAVVLKAPWLTLTEGLPEAQAAPCVADTTELEATVESDDVESEDDELDAADEQPLQALLTRVDDIAEGSWLEMVADDGTCFRCRLAAIIPAADKYILINRQGAKVADKNRLAFAQALQSGRLRVLDDGLLFDRALQSVIAGSDPAAPAKH